MPLDAEVAVDISWTPVTVLPFCMPIGITEFAFGGEAVSRERGRAQHPCKSFSVDEGKGGLHKV